MRHCIDYELLWIGPTDFDLAALAQELLQLCVCVTGWVPVCGVQCKCVLDPCICFDLNERKHAAISRDVLAVVARMATGAITRSILSVQNTSTVFPSAAVTRCCWCCCRVASLTMCA